MAIHECGGEQEVDETAEDEEGECGILARMGLSEGGSGDCRADACELADVPAGELHAGEVRTGAGKLGDEL